MVRDPKTGKYRRTRLFVMTRKVAFWRHETAMGMGRSMICTRHANQG
jgi:hypothetical protein